MKPTHQSLVLVTVSLLLFSRLTSLGAHSNRRVLDEGRQAGQQANTGPATLQAEDVPSADSITDLQIQEILASSRLPGQANSATARIIGGKSTASDAHPYMVALTGLDTSFIICGGALVHPQIVLTAAHCVEAGLLDWAFISSWDFRMWNTNEEKIRIEKVFSHPNYENIILDNDVAAILLSEPSNNPPIQLADGTEDLMSFVDDDDSTGGALAALGWGLTSAYNAYSKPDVLQSIELDYVSNSYCFQFYTDGITENMLCAHKKYAGICDGDSGGPLVQYYPGDAPSQHKLIGLSSFGPNGGCGLANDPSGFTSIAGVLNFVKLIMLEVDMSP